MSDTPNLSEWMPFISKSIELVSAGIIYIFLIENFLIKSYIPGEIIYATNPCKEPYVTDPKSNNPYQKINPFIVLDQDASSRKNSRYDFCNRNDEDLIEKFGKNNKDLKHFLFEMQRASKFDIPFFYNTFRDLNRQRAGKVEYHGILTEYMLLILNCYFKSAIDVRSILKTFHNLISAFDIKNVFFFTLLFIIFLSSYFFMSQNVGSDKPWYYFIFTLFSTIFIQIIGFLILITMIGAGIFFIVNLFYLFTTMPLTFILTGGMPVILLSLGLTAFQSLILFIQFTNFYLPLNSFFRTVTMCDINNYKTSILLILTFFTILNAALYLNSSNLGIFLMTLFIYYIYHFLVSSSSSEATMSETCKKTVDMVDKIKEISDSYLNNVNNEKNN